MFHIIESSALTLYKQQTSKTLFLLPVGRNQIAIITDDLKLILYNIPGQKVIRNVTLPGLPRKAVVIDANRIALLVPEKQSIYEISFDKLKLEAIEVIHTFQSTTHRLMPKNHIKENQYFSTMLIDSFLLSGHVFIRQENTEYRKLFVRTFFKQSKQDKEWKNSMKDLGYSCRKISKMDEEKILIVYKDSDIERSGRFAFKTLNTITLEEQEIELQSQSFTEFSIIVEIKKYKETIFVQVNRKDPELICFQKNIQRQSSFAKSNVLWMVNLGMFFLDLSYSFTNMQNLQLQLRHGLKVHDRIQGKFQNILVNKEGLILEYSKEKSESVASKVTAHRLVSKNKLYLKLLNSAFPKAKQKNYFYKDVLSLLEV